MKIFNVDFDGKKYRAVDMKDLHDDMEKMEKEQLAFTNEINYQELWEVLKKSFIK